MRSSQQVQQNVALGLGNDLCRRLLFCVFARPNPHQTGQLRISCITVEAYGYEIGNGAAEVEKATGRPFEVLQVKQKFGSLRFYVSHGHRTDAILQRIEIGESESLRTCEVCGQPGSCGTTALRRRAMSTPACEPSAVYPSRSSSAKQHQMVAAA
jgi:hypothetical protein